MNLKLISIIGFVIVGTFVLSGCVNGNRVQLYDGTERLSPSKVGTLVVKRSTEIKVDGRPVALNIYPELYHTLKLEMLPGRHEIEWSHESPIGSWVYKGKGDLDAKAGKLYHIRFEFQKGKSVLIRGNSRSSTYRTSITDYATWVEETGLWNREVVVVGKKPKWTEYHKCEICGKNKVTPYIYGCSECRRKW